MLPDLEKIKILERGLYVETSEFNNSIGSPWTEINKFKDIIERIKGAVNADYVGNRSEVITLINIAMMRVTTIIE